MSGECDLCGSYEHTEVACNAFISKREKWQNIKAKRQHAELKNLCVGPTDQEIIEYWNKYDFNFGSAVEPPRVIKTGVFLTACGYHVGSTLQALLRHFGLMKWKKPELTYRGRMYLHEIGKQYFSY